MTDPRVPGWHADPSGDPDRLRWWDGSGWTGIGRDRMPHEVAAPRPDLSWSGGDLIDSGGSGRAAGGGPDLLGGGDPSPDRPARRTAWVAVLAAVGLVAALALGGALPGLDPGAAGDRAAASRSPESTYGLPIPRQSFPTAAPTTPTPVSGRITDASAGLSYDVLPGSWRAWDLFPFDGFLRSVGYYRVLEDNTPAGGQYWANVTSGLVADPQANDLPATAGKVLDGLAAAYYPKHSRRDVVSRATNVDGRPGHLIRYTAVFDPAAARGYAAKSELVAILLVDAGRSMPSALYISLPDTVRSTWASFDRLVASVRVVR